MQVFNQCSEALLTLTQSLLCFLAFRDVADRKNDVGYLSLLRQVRDGVDQGPENLAGWYFLAILADGYVFELRGALAQNLFFTNSKDVERGPVGKERLVIRPKQHDANVQVLHQSPETLLADSQRFFGASAGRHVTDHSENACSFAE